MSLKYDHNVKQNKCSKDLSKFTFNGSLEKQLIPIEMFLPSFNNRNVIFQNKVMNTMQGHVINTCKYLLATLRISCTSSQEQLDKDSTKQC